MCCDSKMRKQQRKIADKLRINNEQARAFMGEFIGTMVLCIMGLGTNAQVVLGDKGNKAHGGFTSVASGWGWAVTMGVYTAGIMGGGVINPAATISFWMNGRIPGRKVFTFIIGQMLGAFVGALIVFANYRYLLDIVEKRVSGETYVEGQRTMHGTGHVWATVPSSSNLNAFFDQVLGTALLVGGALALVDDKGWKMPGPFHAIAIGIHVWGIVGAFAMNCGAPLNPARDLGPRIMLAICGWGTQAFTHSNFYFWVPIFGPIVGAILGTFIYEMMIGIHLSNAGLNVNQAQLQNNQESSNNRETPYGFRKSHKWAEAK